MDAVDKSAAATLENRIFAEQIDLVYRLTPHTLTMSMIGSTLVVAVLWTSAPRAWLLGWYLFHHLVTGARYLLIRVYRRAAPAADAVTPWKQRFVAGTIAAGSVWGVCGTALLPPPGEATQFFIGLYLVGVAATGMFSLSPYFWSFVPLAGGTLLPMAAVLLASGVGGLQLTGTAIFLFLYIALANARRFERMTIESIRLRLQLSEARDAAEAANRAKSRFLANMSHEIRTPMNGVLGIAELLLASPLSEVQHQRLETLYRSGQDLLDVINDILDVSKIEAGRLELRNAVFDLQAMLGDLVEAFAVPAAAKGLTLTLQVAADVPLAVDGDLPRLRQVLTNLVANAIRFTETGGVALLVSRDLDNRIRFVVNDTGPGLAAGECTRVFDAFAQADDSDSRRYGGTGLGLAIARQIVTLMHGEIGVDSTPGGGSTFWFVVPLSAGELPAPQPLPTVTESTLQTLNGHVLLVEDNSVNRMVAEAFLRRFGLQVSVAVDGEQAIAMTAAQRFDVILMDCQMPNIDGFEATRVIRARESEPESKGTAPLPIIALTANAFEGDRDRCLKAGMSDFIAKPFKQTELYEMLARWL
ncbi:MAG: response regulator [Elusimicrobia bacterium]|nr:MAG: response regulator [Elusimicrobiota bacterium]